MKPDEKEAENIRVAVRCRPMNDREIREQAVSCFTAENGNAVLTNLENPSEKHQFGYDFVYGCDSLQESVFQDIGVPILDRAFGGYNGTIFAYGQTGSGKTFSMSGVSGNDVLEGLIPRMNKSIFERIKGEKQQDPNKLFLVECSFFEIYNEIIYDLLDSSGNGKKNKGGLEIKEHSVLGIYVKDLQERVVESRDEVIDLMAQGAQARTVGYTQMNAESSRSHSIFVIKIHQKDSTDESKNIFAKINLVDLAGSERAASTGAQGDRLKEGANINKSLSALGNVINALVEASRTGKKVFIPYRNSKLTRVLQESLGGNSLCSMLATLSPANINYPETLSTLKYASRAKSIKVNAKKNEASSQISQLNEEIAALKKKLMEQTEVTLGLDPKEKDDIVKAYEKQIQEMDRVRLQTWEDKAKLSKQHELERKRLAKEKALADQKIRDERTRKWKLLEEKGDIELMLRALRDLDRSPTTPADVTSGCSSAEDRWLEKAARMKALESESKDHRTMIMVFKDALYKDVEQWGKRNRPDGSETAKRDDSAASFHMTASQLCNKLQNIHQESTQLIALENQLVSENSALINDISSELIRFKEHRSKLRIAGAKPAAGASAIAVVGASGTSGKPAAGAAKEAEQVLEEREKGLSITLSMVQAQRSSAVSFVKSERKRVFNFEEVMSQFLRHIDQQISSSSQDTNAVSAPSASVMQQKHNDGVWRETRNKVVEVAEQWKKHWETEDVKRAGGDAVSYIAKGDVVPLGMESKLIYDENLVVSSKKVDAKWARMHSAQFWIPDEHDQAPSLLVDLELPRFFHSITIRGGCFNGTSAVAHPSSTPANGKQGAEGEGKQGSTTSVPSTFVLKPADELHGALAKFRTGDVSGEHDQTYEILSYTMSWMDLLKTTVVPAKLFARPPVRFLHDVISVVILNTGFAADLFTASEKDYAQISSKTERADYLTKILDFVQETYRKKLGGSASGATETSVVIAATASNILAGKEPTDTLKFLSYFALAALEHATHHRPVAPTPAPTSSPPIDTQAAKSDEINTETAAPNSTSSSLEEFTSGQADSDFSGNKLRECWVKKLRVTTSLNGRDWHVVGDFEANVDASSVKTIALGGAHHQQQQTHTGRLVGRYIKLTCVEWNDLPLLQVELLGQEVHESDALAKSLETLGADAVALLLQLHKTSALLLEEAKVSWEKAKDAEREKQEELTNLGEELVAVKHKCAAYEKQVNELKQAQAQLQQTHDSEAKKFSDERTKSEKLHKELQQAAAGAEEQKKKSEALEVKVGELGHTIQTLTLQQSEQKKTMLALEQSKLDLEKLCGNLQSQLKNRDQQEGHQESKIASMYGELMSANVQLDEFKRKLETSEQMRQEQEAFSAQLHAQVQQTRTTMSEKEQAMEAAMKEKQKSLEDALETLRVEQAQLRASADQAAANEAKLKASSAELESQAKVLQAEVEGVKKKLRDAEAGVAAAAATATTSAAAANAEAGEKLLLEAQTKELRCLAEMEKLEARAQAYEVKQKEAEAKLLESEQERQTLVQRIAVLEESEEEMQLQLQVVTEERDSARQKEEQLFTENNEKEQEIERIRDGYVWVTDRMNSKEDELSELQEQIEKYQSLLEITSASAGKTKSTTESGGTSLRRLHALAFGVEEKKKQEETLMKDLEGWIQDTVTARGPSVRPIGQCVAVDPGMATPSAKSTPSSSGRHSDSSPESSGKALGITDPPSGPRVTTPRTSEQQPAKAAKTSPSLAPAGAIPQTTSAPQPLRATGEPDTHASVARAPSPTQASDRPMTPRSVTKVSTPRGSERGVKVEGTAQQERTSPGSAITNDEDAQEYDDDFDQDENDDGKKARRRSKPSA